MPLSIKNWKHVLHALICRKGYTLGCVAFNSWLNNVVYALARVCALIREKLKLILYNKKAQCSSMEYLESVLYVIVMKRNIEEFDFTIIISERPID